MVDDRITDPTRVAEVLASELTGLQRGVLERVTVVDADRDATPAPDGNLAYRIALAEDQVGRVSLFESAVEVEVTRRPDSPPSADREGLRVATTDGTVQIRIESAAAVKRAVDVLSAVLASAE